MRKFQLFVIAAVLAAVGGIAFAAGPAYFVQAQTVRGSQNPTGPSCVLVAAFKTGEQIVWEAEVYSTATGQVVSPEQAKQLGLKVVVKLENGTTVALEYGQHPKNGEPKVWMWTGAWQIPPVYPTGVLKYDLTVTDNQSNTVVWAPMNQDYAGAQPYPTLITVEKR